MKVVIYLSSKDGRYLDSLKTCAESQGMEIVKIVSDSPCKRTNLLLLLKEAEKDNCEFECLLFFDFESLGKTITEVMNVLHHINSNIQFYSLDDCISSIEGSEVNVKSIIERLHSLMENIQISKIKRTVQKLKSEKRIGRLSVKLNLDDLMRLSRETRNGKKLSLKEISAELGCSPQTIMRRKRNLEAVASNEYHGLEIQL
jgi:hypothetical protein